MSVGGAPTVRERRAFEAGEIAFGPSMHQLDGSVRQFGALPVKGLLIRTAHYRTGEGRSGNVARGAIQVLRSSIPYVVRVENREAARGGGGGETVQEAKVARRSGRPRGPRAAPTSAAGPVPRRAPPLPGEGDGLVKAVLDPQGRFVERSPRHDRRSQRHDHCIGDKERRTEHDDDADGTPPPEISSVLR
ncbi:hypothetical protein [Streptomyces chattanoogensis]|uniref:hypothetical protein n=1 Tax=Streptomyces chattanoogensis TaxID=66876 RepID=UPI00368BC619